MTLPNVPDSFTTRRLELRMPMLADLTQVYDGVRESLPELKPWMPWATDEYSLEGCELNLRQAIASFVTRQDLRFHLFDRSSSEFLGSSGLHRINWRVPRFEIGYWIRTPKAGNGYVSEAVRGLTRLAFERLGAQRVEIRCDDRNLASSRVAERCGFELDGVLRNWQRGSDGSLNAERIYSVVSLDQLSE